MERALMRTLQGLLEDGWRVRLIARRCEIPPQPNFEWHRVRALRRPTLIAQPVFAVIAGIKLSAARRAPGPVVAMGAIIPNRVDIVIVQFCQAGFVKKRIVRASKRSRLYMLHGRAARAFNYGLERWSYRPDRVKRMIAVSDVIRREVRANYGLERVPIDVIGNGVDVAAFAPDSLVRRTERQRLGITDDELVALFVGGDWARKGLRIAMDACSRAGWRLIVVGRGDTETWQATADALTASVTFVGHLRDPERFFSAADAFVLPSSYEGFALVSIEAAAAGLPLLLSEATGAGALVTEVGSQFLPLDADAFTRELERLTAHPELRLQLGELARTGAMAFDWSRIVPAYARVFAEVAADLG